MLPTGVLYAGFLAGTLLVVRDELAFDPSWLDRLGALAMVLVSLFVLPGALAFMLDGAKLNRFEERGLTALTWRGRRRLAWHEVECAVLESGDPEEGVSHLLRLEGPTATIRVKLQHYRRAATLLAEILARIPVDLLVADGVDPADVRDS